MKRLLLFLLLTVFAIGFAQKTTSLRWGGAETKELKGKNSGHSFRVVLRVHNAKAGGRKITFRTASDKAIASDGILINGARTWGFDGIPHEWVGKKGTAKSVLEEHATEIIQFDVWIDGKRMRIPRKKYEMVLQPDLTSARAVISTDKKYLLVTMGGSDGAGSWGSQWAISMSGRVDVVTSSGD